MFCYLIIIFTGPPNRKVFNIFNISFYLYMNCIITLQTNLKQHNNPKDLRSISYFISNWGTPTWGRVFDQVSISLAKRKFVQGPRPNKPRLWGSGAFYFLCRDFGHSFYRDLVSYRECKCKKTSYSIGKDSDTQNIYYQSLTSIMIIK